MYFVIGVSFFYIIIVTYCKTHGIGAILKTKSNKEMIAV